MDEVYSESAGSRYGHSQNTATFFTYVIDFQSVEKD
jgi:hypothetical protein